MFHRWQVLMNLGLLLLLLLLATCLPPVLAMSRQRRLGLREQVREMFFHSFNSYLEFGFPEDEVNPISCTPRKRDADPNNVGVNDVLGDYCLTLVDAMDTLALMGDAVGFRTAVEMALKHVKFAPNKVQVFESTIRVLGGLLSSHLLATDSKFGMNEDGWYQGELLALALDLATRYLPAFETKTGIPYPRINLAHGVPPSEIKETCTAGAGTLLLEFGVLSRLTGDPRFESLARNALLELWRRRSSIGLVGNTINIETGYWHDTSSGIGAGIDSFYEYLMKAHVLFGDKEYWDVFRESYEAVMENVKSPSGYFFPPVNMYSGAPMATWIDSLSAFFAGLQVLAGDVRSAVELHEVYYSIWRRVRLHRWWCSLVITTKYNGLPERWDYATKDTNLHWYPLRPELIESTYLLYQATKDDYYLEAGERFVHDFQTYMRKRCGFASVSDITTMQTDDRMESFFLSETLKYLYLLFDEGEHMSAIPLYCKDNLIHKWDSNHVWTTEGHLMFLPRSFLKPQPSNLTSNSSWETCTNFAWDKEALNAACPMSKFELRALHSAVGLKQDDGPGICPAVPNRKFQPQVEEFTIDLSAIALRPQTAHYRVLQSEDILANTIHALPMELTTVPDGEYVVTMVQGNVFPDGKRFFVLQKDLLSLNKGEPWADDYSRNFILRYFFDSSEGLLDRHWNSSVIRRPMKRIARVFYNDAEASNALYGPTLDAPLGRSRYPFQGSLTFLPNNRDGCDPYTSSMVRQARGTAVLVFRGRCMFTEKTLNAQKAGASLLIIANTDDTLMQMVHATGASEDAYDIPTVSISLSDGLRLLNAWNRGMIAEVTLFPPWMMSQDVRPVAEERPTLKYRDRAIRNIVVINKDEFDRISSWDLLDASTRQRIGILVRRVLKPGMSFRCLRQCPVKIGRGRKKVACCGQ